VSEARAHDGCGGGVEWSVVVVVVVSGMRQSIAKVNYTHRQRSNEHSVSATGRLCSCGCLSVSGRRTQCWKDTAAASDWLTDDQLTDRRTMGRCFACKTVCTAVSEQNLIDYNAFLRRRPNQCCYCCCNCRPSHM